MILGRPSVAAALALMLAGCGGDTGSTSTSSPGSSPPAAAPPTATLDARTNLDTAPLSAADYALYAAIMGGASAILADMSADDRAALELEKKGSPTKAASSPEGIRQLARARELHRMDEELARLQGIDRRYLEVKEKIEAVIGPHARPPAPDDAVARENLRFLEAHRANIERLQKILQDPLSRAASAGSPLRVE